jgi:hypothetical protein
MRGYSNEVVITLTVPDTTPVTAISFHARKISGDLFLKKGMGMFPVRLRLFRSCQEGNAPS